MVREEGRALFWFDAEVEVQGKGGKEGRRAALTCNAVLCLTGQSFAGCHCRGWGHGLAAAKESCRSDRECEIDRGKRERGREEGGREREKSEPESRQEKQLCFQSCRRPSSSSSSSPPLSTSLWFLLPLISLFINHHRPPFYSVFASI